MQSADFSLAALYAALDHQRRARGLTWSQATREINRQSERASIHPLSPSTVISTRTKAIAEADGVLQMLLWLNRAPESFVPGWKGAEDVEIRLPAVSPHQILRFDTGKLHAALDLQRRERKLTWAQIASEIGVTASNLTRLSKGGRTAFPHVMRIVRWLQRPASEFTRAAVW